MGMFERDEQRPSTVRLQSNLCLTFVADNLRKLQCVGQHLHCFIAPSERRFFFFFLKRESKSVKNSDETHLHMMLHDVHTWSV